MGDWRAIERDIVEFFRTRGYRPAANVGQERFAGDWIVKHGNKPINLSDLARELAIAPRERQSEGDNG